MIKEAIGVGDTLVEATEKAKAELNASFDDDVQFEVLSEPKKKTLGLFGGSQAKVRVFIEVPDPVPAKSKKNDNRKNENKNDTKKDSKQKPTKKPVEKAVDEAQNKPAVPAVPAEEINPDSKVGRAVAYLKTILANLNVADVKIMVAAEEKSAKITLEGEDIGIIIGHRGETLDALQYLTSLAANSGDGFFRVSLDTGNYREKREQTLKSVARRTANQVLKNGRSRALEPMSAYERRIIHTEIQQIEGVESNSIGEGRNRKVVISVEGGFRKNERPMRDDRRAGRNNRGRGGRGNSRPAVTVDPDRVPKKDATDLPLYGKID